MRIPRGEPKGQANIEYALLLALVGMVVLLIMVLFVPFIISGVGQIINAVRNSLDLQPPTPPPISPSTSPSKRNFIITITVLTTMGLPAIVSFITSIWDGAVGNPGHLAAASAQVRRDNQGRCTRCGAIESSGRLSAKLCLSAISFEIWGITNSFQDKVELDPRMGVENSHLAILLVILILVDIAFHFLCSKWIPDKHMPFRLVLVLLSVLFPVGVFYGLTV